MKSVQDLQSELAAAKAKNDSLEAVLKTIASGKDSLQIMTAADAAKSATASELSAQIMELKLLISSIPGSPAVANNRSM